MRKYNDIGDLYRERFSNYAPEPPSSVWENVQSANAKKQSLQKKITFSLGGIIAVGVVAYLLIAINPKTNEFATTTLNDTRENTENKVFDYEKTPSENISEIPNEKNTSVSQQANSVNSSATKNERQVSSANNDYSNSNLTEQTSSETTEQNTPVEKKITPAITANTEQIHEQSPLKTGQNESKSKKILPIISKDTSICENTAVQLYAYNVENIRWSTGEKRNLITVYPSNGEHYSLTYSNENSKDTTVYIHVKVVRCAEIHIPNAFTPNGDGLNDFFLAKADMELKSFEMIIYAGNGRDMMFSSKDINRGWDGTYRGQTQPHGLYYYTVRYIDNFGKYIEKRGELLLIIP